MNFYFTNVVTFCRMTTLVKKVAGFDSLWFIDIYIICQKIKIEHVLDIHIIYAF